MKDDLISRQAAIDAMCDACETVQAVCAHYPCERYLAIEGTPSAQPWIPVSERLPEIEEGYTSKPCLVYCRIGEEGTWDYAYGFAKLEKNIFGQVGWNCERDDEYNEALGEVLAWQPLPKPYHDDIRRENKA